MRKKPANIVRKNPAGYFVASDGSGSDLQLSTPKSEEAILAELEGWIRGGRLEPGHRLPSIKAIQKMLKVGQRSVEVALDSLSRRGLIETRNRSGNYLMANAREILATENNRMLKSSWILDHYLPRADRRTLTVYTIDCVGRMKAVWDQIVRNYQERYDLQIRLLTPSDGHLMEVLKQQEVDLIHSTPEMFQAIGWEKFREIDRENWFEEFTADLLPQVRTRMNSNLNRRAFPFAITVLYLFLNRSMAMKFNLPLEIPSNPLMFLRMARENQAILRPAGFDSFLVPSISDLLLMTGGLMFSPNGQVIYDRAQSEKCLTVLAGSKLRQPNPVEIPNDFASGLALTMRHCSFTCSELIEHLRFDWRALPVPMALGTQDIAWLTLLAIPQASQYAKEALHLVEFLWSKETQSEFAAIGGNLPVRRSSISAVADAGVNHVLPEDIHRALAQSELSWPHFAWSKFSGSENLIQATGELLVGECGPEAVLSLIENLVMPTAEKI